MLFLTRLTAIKPQGLLEVLLLAVLIYYILLFFKGTRGAQVLMGFAGTLVALSLLTRLFRLDALNWLVTQLSLYLALAFLVVFQPEIRRALAELGKQHVFASSRRERSLVEHIVRAAMMLSERKIGALIGIEREIGTRSIQETGTRIDSQVTPELLASIFYPHTPLHDGGVIVRHNRIVAAGCLFPLSHRTDLSKALGTRHRAAVGLTEETDAVAVVVSEETGTISIAYKGRLKRGLDEDRLRRVLAAFLTSERRSVSRFSRVKAQIDLTPEHLARADSLAGSEEDADGFW